MRVPTGYCYIETGEGDLRFIPQPGPKPFALFTVHFDRKPNRR